MRRAEDSTDEDYEREQVPAESHMDPFLQRVISDHKWGACHRVLWYARPMRRIYQSA
jgi:hypothetical protein